MSYGKGIRFAGAPFDPVGRIGPRGPAEGVRRSQLPTRPGVIHSPADEKEYGIAQMIQ